MQRRTSTVVVLGLIGLAVTVAVGMAWSQTTGGPGGHVRPGGGAGGTYRGPGDTVPPCPPWCPSPPPPLLCDRTCESNYLGEGCNECDMTKGVTTSGLIGWSQAPPCFLNEFGYVFHVTVNDLLNACSASGDNIATICMNLGFCGNGVDGIFVYETIPFQWFESGLPASDGSHFHACGMSYGFDVVHADGFCEEWEQDGYFGPYLFNSQCRAYQCQPLAKANLQIDCTCFTQLLQLYQALGLYGTPTSWLQNGDPAFSVVVKCCLSEENPTCDPACDPISH